MIVFNLWAVPVGIVIFLLYLGIEHLFPGLLNEPYETYTISALLIIVGGIGDWIGVKARLFFLPVWLIGIGLICFKIGPIGWVLLGLIAVAGVLFILRWGAKKAAEAWEKAQRELVQAPTPSTAKEREFWQWVETVLHIDICANFTPEVCEHDLKVLEAIKKANPQLGEQEKAALVLLGKFLANAKNLSKPPTIDVKLRDALQKMIEARLKGAKPEMPFRSAAVTPPLVPA